MTNMHIIRLGLIASAAMLASGCAFRPQVAGMAIEYNEFVAQATNRQTAINILRARDREPLHFTSFTKVLGQARVEGAAELGSAINGNSEEGLPTATGFNTTKKVLGATNWTPKLSVKVNSGTDFEIAINATDDFWKGIVGPVAPSTLVYYLNQDWPADLLSHLFISRIELIGTINDTTDPARRFEPIVLETIYNMPDEKTKVDRFSQVLKCRQLSYKLDPKPGRKLPIAQLDDLSGVEADTLSKLREPDAAAGTKAATLPAFEYPISDKNEFRIALSPQLNDTVCAGIEAKLMRQFATDVPKGLVATNPAKAAPQGMRAHARLALSGSTLTTGDLSSRDTAVSNAGAAFNYPNYFSEKLAPGLKGDLSIAITLRSIEGVIYYLGQYLRHPDTSPKLEDPSCPREEPYCLPIIQLSADDSAKDPFVTVEFKGKRYVIPSSGADLNATAGRSSQVVTLVQQMLNLHRSAKDLPSTPLVRVLN